VTFSNDPFGGLKAKPKSAAHSGRPRRFNLEEGLQDLLLSTKGLVYRLITL